MKLERDEIGKRVRNETRKIEDMRNTVGRWRLVVTSGMHYLERQ